MSFSENKRYYFFLETLKSRGDVEVVMIIADFEEPFFSGIMLDSTERSNYTILKPAASRILLKRIDIDNDEDALKQYVGIYHDSLFNEEVKKWIDNESNATSFFPNNDALLMMRLKKSEQDFPSIAEPLPFDRRL